MKVTIRVTRKVEYASIVEMTPERFEELENMLDGSNSERRQAENVLNDLIDVHDWQDDRLDSIDDFEPFVESEQSSPAQPL